jgi:polysaccharide chain length determinant protein (PEP-CTERM system associated)
MDEKQRQMVNKYLDLFFRRKLFIITLVLVSLPIGLGFYLNTPKVYQAVSLLSYQQQKINPNAMSPDVKSNIYDIVNTLSQIVTSRTNLENIIKDLNLYPEQRKQLPIEDVVEMLRKKIKITPSGKGNVFSIMYSGSKPDQVVRVTNAIAAKFIEENLKYRQERATDTSNYTNQELQMAKKVMDAQENAMRDYKLQNYNEMPEHREANMSQLTSLQLQYQNRQESIQDLERTLVMIQDQLNNRKMLAQRPVGSDKDGELDAFQSLANLRATLDALLLKYTEKHPEIIRVRKLISKMEAEAEGGGAAKNSSTAMSRQTSTESQDHNYDPILMQLEVQRKGIGLKIASIENEKEQLKNRIEQYEKWVAAAPGREAEWSSLTREYGQLKKHYDKLVTQNLQAESMVNLEERQKGSQFKIEDPATYPGKPVKPKFLMIMGMSILIGLGAGVGGAFALDIFDASFRDPETLEPFLGIPLLITIPYIETKAEQKKMRWQLIFTVGFLLLGSGLIIGLFGFAWVKGYIVV